MGKKEHIIKKIKEFVEKVNKDIKIDKIIFFGSRASSDKIDKDADIDLIIVSDDFKNMDFFERAAKMYNYWELNYAVDFLCYTKNEFNKLKKKTSIVKEALSHGIIIN